MNQTQPLRVKSGLPWWLWIMLAFATIAIGAGVIFSSVPDDPKQLFQQAQKEFEASEQENFLVTLAKLEKFPAYEAHTKLLKGMHASRQSRDPKAIELYEEALQNAEIKPLVLQQLGDVKSRLGDFRGAISDYEEAIELAPETADRSRILLAKLYYAVGTLKLAEDTLNVVVQNESANREARTMLGRLKVDQRRFEEAMEDYSALLKSPGDFAAASPALLEGYARCALETGNKEVMTTISKEYVPLIEDMILKTQIQIALGDIEAIESALMEGVQNPDATLPTKISAAMIEVASGKNDKAQQLLTECIQMAPRDLRVMEAAAKLYAATGDTKRQAIAQQNVEQIKDLQAQRLEKLKSIGNSVDDPQSRFEMGLLSVQLAEFNEVQRWFGVVLAMDPTMASKCSEAVEKSYSMFGMLVPFGGEDDSQPVKTEEPKTEDPKTEDPKSEDPKSEDPKSEDPKSEEPKS